MKLGLFLGIAILLTSILSTEVESKSCNETLINASEITTYAVYESGNVQAKRYALYIFNAALILLIMSMKVKYHETTESHGKDHT
ncbi:MAG: hypothetical protein V1906_00575 [Candidatus Woesearchaeota archaeon]